MIEICVLASGSKANSIYIHDDETGILIDAGLSRKETLRRLEEKGLGGKPIDAILITHEHSDHIRGLNPVSTHFKCPVFANRATGALILKLLRNKNMFFPFENGVEFELKKFRINSFSIAHDGIDPVGFELMHPGGKICIATDIGFPTSLVKERIKQSNVLILEANHEEEMVFNGNRPWEVKQRIVGRKGHLSNKDLGHLVEEVAGPELNMIFLAHMSQDHNEPVRAADVVSNALRKRNLSDVEIKFTWQDRPTDVCRLPLTVSR